MTAADHAQGGCHCGAVRFDLKLPASPIVLDCNCSICSMVGFRHLIVPHGDFTLLHGRESLSSYRFGTGAAEHLFCVNCGIKGFYQPRSHPDCWSVNFRCIDGWAQISHVIQCFDGQNWEDAHRQLGE